MYTFKRTSSYTGYRPAPDLRGGLDPGVAELEPEHGDPHHPGGGAAAAAGHAHLVQPQLGRVHGDPGARPAGGEPQLVEVEVDLGVLGALQQQPGLVAVHTWQQHSALELLTINRRSCTITEKAPTRAFSEDCLKPMDRL